MLGGQWRPTEEQEDLPSSQPQKQARGSKAMPVSDFLAKGEGGTLLPRSRQVQRKNSSGFGSAQLSAASSKRAPKGYFLKQASAP